MYPTILQHEEQLTQHPIQLLSTTNTLLQLLLSHSTIYTFSLSLQLSFSQP